MVCVYKEVHRALAPIPQPLPSTMKNPLRPLCAALALITLLPSATVHSDGEPSKMILVPAGPFIMGADDVGELDERPSKTITLDAFYIDYREATNADYQRCIDAGRCEKPRPLGARFQDPDRPVVGVNWESAKAFCAFVGKRLLTEAEWEKAARGTKGQMYPWGDDKPVKGTHGCVDWLDNRPCLPGSWPKGDSPYGVTDMAGNVWEWVEDVYDGGYYPRRPDTNPTGSTCKDSLAFHAKLIKERKEGYTGGNGIPTECERGLRGGAWNYPLWGLRSSNRVHHPPRFRINVAGIRCGADAPPATPSPAKNAEP